MKKHTLILACLGATLLSSNAMAGKTQPAVTDVDLVAFTAGGDMVTARYSDHKKEMIGCGVRKIQNSSGLFSFGFCQAEDRDGERGFCNTQDEGLLDAIYASGDTGYITFSWNEKSGECTRIGFSNQSFYLPKGLGSNE